MLDQQQYEKFLSYCYFNHIPPSEFQEGYLGYWDEQHHFQKNSIISNHLREWLQIQQEQCEGDFSTAQLVQFSTKTLNKILVNEGEC